MDCKISDKEIGFEGFHNCKPVRVDHNILKGDVIICV